jgi:hypothetical protein
VGFFYSRYEWQSGFATPELSGIKRHVSGPIGRGREFAMPTKRQRGEAWEIVVRRKGVLPKPLYFVAPTGPLPSGSRARLARF